MQKRKRTTRIWTRKSARARWLVRRTSFCLFVCVCLLARVFFTCLCRIRITDCSFFCAMTCRKRRKNPVRKEELCRRRAGKRSLFSNDIRRGGTLMRYFNTQSRTAIFLFGFYSQRVRTQTDRQTDGCYKGFSRILFAASSMVSLFLHIANRTKSVGLFVRVGL